MTILWTIGITGLNKQKLNSSNENKKSIKSILSLKDFLIENECKAI